MTSSTRISSVLNGLLSLLLIAGLAGGCGSSKTPAEKTRPARDCQVDYDRENYVLARVTAKARFEHTARQTALARASQSITRKLTQYTGDFFRQNPDMLRGKGDHKDGSSRMEVRSAFSEVAAAKLGGLRVLSCDTYVEDGEELYSFYLTAGVRIGELAETFNQRVEANPVLNASFADEELKELTKSWVRYVATQESRAADSSQNSPGEQFPE